MSGNRALAIGLAPAAVVAVGVVVGVLVTGTGLYTNPPAENGVAENAVAAPAGPATAGTHAAEQAEITKVMEQNSRAQNDGDAASLRATLCKGTLAGAPEFEDGPPLTEQRIHIDSVTDVRVAGSSATAVISASVEGQPELGAKTTQLLFVNEDGWKLCMSS